MKGKSMPVPLMCLPLEVWNVFYVSHATWAHVSGVRFFRHEPVSERGTAWHRIPAWNRPDQLVDVSAVKPARLQLRCVIFYISLVFGLIQNCYLISVTISQSSLLLTVLC